jgi:hypothetical protein
VSVQAADPAVAQPVEHQFGELAGGGDHADVAATAGGDPVADLPEPGVSADALDGLDRRPPDQPRSQGPGVVPFWCDVPGLSVCGVAA